MWRFYMKRYYIIFVLCFVFLLNGCSRSRFTQYQLDRYQDDISERLHINEKSGLRFINVTENDSERKAEIVVTFDSPISPSNYIDKCRLVRDAVVDVFNDDLSNVGMVTVCLIQNDNIIFIWDTYDLATGYLGDYRKDGNTQIFINLNDAKTVDLTDSEAVINPFDRYLLEHGITLTNSDVQNDMADNVDKYFSLKGKAELSDYYAYGFTEDIKNYYCIKVTSENDTDSWYIYCSKLGFSQLYNDMKLNTCDVKLVCIIPKDHYQDGQCNMARLYYAQW